MTLPVVYKFSTFFQAFLFSLKIATLSALNPFAAPHLPPPSYYCMYRASPAFSASAVACVSSAPDLTKIKLYSVVRVRQHTTYVVSLGALGA